MPSFILTATDDQGVVTTKEFHSDYLTDVIDNTSDFLRGVGFYFNELSVSNESHVKDKDLEDTRVDDNSVVFLREKYAPKNDTVYKDTNRET
tara:strand:+ start:1286 stop:1561 length:276 start_codon:yes stop_codon:yes gene_type:complete